MVLVLDLEDINLW